MSRARQFLKNVASNYVVTGVRAVIFILLTPFVVHRLGLEHYAVWVIVQTLGFYLGFFDAGLPDAQVRQHAALLARRDHAGLSQLLGTVAVLYLGAGGLALLATAGILYAPTAELFDIPASAGAVYGPVVFLVGITAAFSFVKVGADGVLEGYQRYDIGNAIELVHEILAALAVVSLLATGHGIVALAAVTCAVTASSAATKIVVVRRLFAPAAAARLGFDRESFGTIRSFSLWNSLNEFMTEGTANFDKLLIPILLTSALVTPYSLIMALAAAIFLLAEPITDTFLPISSARHAARDERALTALLMRGTKLVTVATLPLTIVIVFFGKSILDIWVGEEYTNVSISVLWFSAANFFFSTYLWTALNVLLGAGEMRRIFMISVFEVALVLVLILSLVPLFGLPGLALGGLLANVVTGLFLFIPAACRHTALRPAGFVARSLVPALLAAVPGYLVAFAFARWMNPQTFFELVLAAGVTAIASLLALLQFAATRWERARYLVTFKRLARAN